MKELIQQCKDLPRAKKLRLIRILKASIEEEEKRDDSGGDRFALFYKAATDVCGMGILGNAKDRVLVIGRRMITYKMRQEGFSFYAIARHLQKHHSSIICGVKMMQDAFDFQFKEEMKLWNAFLEKVAEYEKKISSEVV